MLADVVDVDELKTGKRREGDMYSLFVLFQKSGLGVAMSISGYVLSAVGYEAPPKFSDTSVVTPIVSQPEAVTLSLRIMLCAAPICLLILSFIVMLYYPIDKKTHQQTLAELKLRRETRRLPH